MEYLWVTVVFLLFAETFQTTAYDEVCIVGTTEVNCNCYSPPPLLPELINTPRE